MKTFFDCIPCFLRQAVEACGMATKDKKIQERALRSVLSELGKTSLADKTPADISHVVHRIVREVTGNNDPYKKLKDKYNKMALRLYPELKRRVAASKDRLLTATKLAIAGNIIDFGPGHNFDLERTIEEVLHQDFALGHFSKFKEALQNSEVVAYLADNAGEIIFDRILLEELKGRKINFVVKGGPIINDATVEDAKFAGIDKMANLATVSNGERGTGPERNSASFVKFLKSMDVVISKGQGNYEALSEIKANIFFLLKVKCPVIADEIKVEVGDMVLLTSRE